MAQSVVLYHLQKVVFQSTVKMKRNEKMEIKIYPCLR
jgi:hypothetical protein